MSKKLCDTLTSLRFVGSIRFLVQFVGNKEFYKLISGSILFGAKPRSLATINKKITEKKGLSPSFKNLKETKLTADGLGP